MQDDDVSEQLVIHQSKMPFFRESLPFTSEVPRQLSRQQYFDFFKNEERSEDEKGKKKRGKLKVTWRRKGASREFKTATIPGGLSGLFDALPKKSSRETVD